MEEKETSDPASHCVICSASIEFSADSTNTSPSDLKLANAFIQCLTLDLDYAKDLTNDLFCLQCKLHLEEWNFCQNEMVRLVARSRQLKASLIAKLLESPGKLVPRNYSKLHRNFQLIRQSIRKQFHPQVVLEKTEPPAPDFQGRSNCHQETAGCTGIVQVKQETLNDLLEDCKQESNSFNLDKDDEFPPLEEERNPLELDQEQQNINANFESPSGTEHPFAWSSKKLQRWGKSTPVFASNVIREVHPGEYLYRDTIPFYYNGTRSFTCGRCKNEVRGGTHNMEKHLRFCENRYIPPWADPELPLPHPRRSRTNDASAKAPETTRAEPTFKTRHITKVKPGEYLYRKRIRLYYKDERFTCGQCNVVISCKNSNHSSLKRHLSRCDRRDEIPSKPRRPPPPATCPPKSSKALDHSLDLRNLALPRRHPPSPSPAQSSVKFVEKLPASSSSTSRRKQFLFQRCFGAKVTLKDGFYHCTICDGTFGTLEDVRRHTLLTTANSARHKSQPTKVSAQAHYTCHICGLEFTGADSGLQCQSHIATAHANSRLRPILPAPPKSSACDPANFIKQNGFMGLPVAILVPSTQQQDNITEDNNASETEPAVGTEDAGLIVPDIMDDELDNDNVDQMESASERDPLQLMKIDIDYPEAEI